MDHSVEMFVNKWNCWNIAVYR